MVKFGMNNSPMYVKDMLYKVNNKGSIWLSVLIFLVVIVLFLVISNKS
jgi:hypothetical protein